MLLSCMLLVLFIRMRVLGLIIYFFKFFNFVDEIFNIRGDVNKIYDYRLIVFDVINMKEGIGFNIRLREKKVIYFKFILLF